MTSINWTEIRELFKAIKCINAGFHWMINRYMAWKSNQFLVYLSTQPTKIRDVWGLFKRAVLINKQLIAHGVPYIKVVPTWLTCYWCNMDSPTTLHADSPTLRRYPSGEIWWRANSWHDKVKYLPIYELANILFWFEYKYDL